MKQLFFILFFITSFLNAAIMETYEWKKGESLLTFFENNNIPLHIYYDLDSEDRELATEIQSGRRYEILKDDDGQLEQVLIPVGEELQFHIIKDKKTNKFMLQTTPVSYVREDLSIVVAIKNNPYQDIVNATNNPVLANEFMNVYGKSVDFKNLRTGDKLVIFYSQKRRLGKRYGGVNIDAALIETRGSKNYVFLYEDNRYLNDDAKEVNVYAFEMPLKTYKRISSPFTYKRWHPVLKRYRAHLGIDYAAHMKTRIYASGIGRISYIGNKGGYGKTIEIIHEGGYKTLYAHLNDYAKGLRYGSRVKKGQLIAYVGNTGISTGPHLHFGLYRNGRAMNPAKIVKITKSGLYGKKKQEYLKYVQQYKERFKNAIKENNTPKKEEFFDSVVSLEMQ